MISTFVIQSQINDFQLHSLVPGSCLPKHAHVIVSTSTFSATLRLVLQMLAYSIPSYTSTLQRQSATLDDSKGSHDDSEDHHPQQENHSLNSLSKSPSIKLQLSSLAQLATNESHNGCHNNNEDENRHGLHALFLVRHCARMGGLDLKEIRTVG